MKKVCFAALLALVLGIAPIAHPPSACAATLFYDNFESGSLSQWSTTDGQIVTDPLNSSNHVLNFAADKSGGDAFTASSFALTSGVTYTFSFDYLGTDTSTSEYTQAFAGISPLNTTVPIAGWVYSSVPGYGSAQLLTNDDTWHSYTFNFSDNFLNSIGGSTVYLVFEQAAGTPSTAYFDDVSLSSPSAVPIPAAVWLLGPGLIGLAGIRRRFKK